MRFDLRADLVSVPADDEDAVLYHLPYLQLGPLDDVFANYHSKQFLLMGTCYFFIFNMAYMGTVRIYIS